MLVEFVCRILFLFLRYHLLDELEVWFLDVLNIVNILCYVSQAYFIQNESTMNKGKCVCVLSGLLCKDSGEQTKYFLCALRVRFLCTESELFYVQG